MAKHKKAGHRPVTLDTRENVWHCNDCGKGGSVIDWVMLERGCTAAEAMQFLGGGRNGQRERTRLRPIRQTLGLVKTYDYTDEKGELLFQACRYVPKDFRQRRVNGKGGWIDNTTGVPRVLYRLPEVIKAQTVAIAEGEKDVDALVALGIAATCNPMGAKKWRDEYSEALRDKDVVIFGDDDEDGREHVEQVIESLTRISRTIKRVSLPEGFHDVSDYIASLPEGTAAEAIAKLIDATPELSSLNSLARNDDDQAVVDDFPEPLSEVAFHSLAGDIVRRIEPHTEADSAALLIHILTMFGNAVGRNPHAMADGARHGTNIYCVNVGKTSKSRKGTAKAHIQRIVTRVDETWAKESITSGLNSGEGLIYTVRDPVSKRVKQKGGSYAETIVDDGAKDKRALFIESELASTLRVMTRDGNTLSAVMRDAWDGSVLRTAIKNSPNVATGAHISIIGHVTRDEVRRELNATEQANGFANRFLWLAVRRSKCLPEGGDIESENLNDLVTRLHNAIEFARNAGEITRSEGARELWRICYPALSEGKPGLLGAITARAEAQVLRLSCNYALLLNYHHRRASSRSFGALELL